MKSSGRGGGTETPSPAVQANDFRRQWECIRDGASAALERVGQSGWLILGEEVRAFEREFAAWWGVRHAIGVASGLDALEIALRCARRALGTDHRHRVLTTPLTAFATTLAICRAGFEPVWCDVEESGALDLGQADLALRDDASIFAVVPVHLYGHPLDLRALARLATDHGVAIVEDCAQSAGAARDGRATATASVAAATSLYPTKNLGAMGDGGVVLTDSDSAADYARCLRDYGQLSRYEHVEIGLNSRLDELQAAILRSALLPRLNQWLARRTEIASRYAEAIREMSGTLRVISPTGGSSAHHLFPVEVIGAEPGEVAARMDADGVAVARHYPFLCSDQPAARGLGVVKGGSLPVARRLARAELSLPIHPHLSDQEVGRVIDACSEAST